MTERLIYHIFADDGVESEALSPYGRVVRVGINPQKNRASEAIKADARDLSLRKEADLAFLQPPCGRWAAAPKSYNQEPREYPNFIEKARDIGERYAKHYIIENVPQAPLINQTELSGYMFGLPLKMKRAFETSFYTPEPPVEHPPEYQIDWWNGYARPMDFWKALKGYSITHRKDPFVKAGIPRAMMEFLIRHWLIEIESIDIDRSAGATDW